MSQIKRHRETGNAVGTKPAVRQPAMRTENKTPIFQFAVKHVDFLLERADGEREPEVAEARIEQSLVGPARPGVAAVIRLGVGGRDVVPLFFSTVFQFRFGVGAVFLAVAPWALPRGVRWVSCAQEYIKESTCANRSSLCLS